MENIVKGWALTLIGLIGVVGILLHWTGFYEMPNPDFLSKTWEIVIALIICTGLAVFPRTKIEVYLEVLFSAVIALFKKKTESPKE